MRLAGMKDTPLKVPYTELNVNTLLINRLTYLMSSLSNEQQRLVVVCIGTDRSTGDALGPLVGTYLSKYRSPYFEIFGTLDEPVHAMNLDDTLIEINKQIRKPFVIGIDACLGQVSSVGCIQVGSGPVRPGAGVNKDLPPVGDIHMTGIVNVGGFMEYFVLQNTRLQLVIRMSEIIAQSLFTAIAKNVHQSTPAATQE
ncbi:spore protease YyaC [Paenibacillus oenotherae]|uniref:Spore protease YyaC n=1 Tax=Paenibacillus oenotherae TaxID=1435645 RepID=A0ABS7D6S2_9BACL|nr:spore protease YyaC [Paenibacillus oenotherae]MBW7475640.1 spore protease YyaC [Paenibacillus oenotherae]